MVILEKDVEGIIWNSTIEQLKAQGLIAYISLQDYLL